MLKSLVNDRTNLTVLMILVVIAVSTSWLSAVDNPDAFMDAAWRSGWYQNFSTEMFGAIATFLLFELVVGDRTNKKRILLNLRSPDNATALNALAEAHASGMLKDGSLREVNLVSANLAGANLWSANLAGANLGLANLAEANLGLANLAEANLGFVNLAGADLWSANLAGADLQDANLKRAHLQDVTFDNKTVLPDAVKLRDDDDGNPIHDKYWTPDTDMTRYTEPDHPDFWQPDWVKRQNDNEPPINP